MRFLHLPLSVLAVVLTWPVAESPAASRRKECRLACDAAVDACVDAGGKRKRCKRQTLKRCRRDGLETCVVATTTTTTTPGATTTTGAGSTTTIDGATTTNPGGTTTTTTSPGGSTTTLPAVHGCTQAAAVDRRDPGANRTVTFTSYAFTPRCIRIQAGQTVTFSGSFTTHPLQGGEIVGITETPDPTSPIPFTEDGLSANIPFPAAGVFPFYCDQHGVGEDMRGAVYVDP